ncbi:MAG: glycoside hydrolase family 43 protein [Brevundimonas sp.]
MRACTLSAALAISLLGCSAAAQEAAFEEFRYAGSDPANAAPLEAGQYRNPILQGFYPDPSITRAGDDYYLVTSTFAYFPGIPVFHSRDLVNWTQIGNAIDRPDQLDFGTLGLSRGVFAPAIEHHDGTFWILNTCVDCGDNFLITASDPAGPWSDPVWLPDLAGGIDPSLFFDSDGSAWILNNGPPEGEPRYDGHRAIWIQRFDPVAKRTFGPRTVLVDGGVEPETNPIWIEGPHLIRRGEWVYLICAEGGTAEGHSQVVLRARSPEGPFEPWEGNPILTQRDLPRDRTHPITSAGHADFVQLPDGSWWATFLAVRPYEGDFYNTGRETFLMPVDWSGEWPVITRPGEAIPYAAARPNLADAGPGPEPTSGAFEIEETFDTPLGPQWMMMRNPRETWSRVEEGRLVLDARPAGLGDNGNPSFLARRQQHQNAAAETTLSAPPTRIGDRFGFAALQSDDYWHAISVVRTASGPRVELRSRTGADQPADGVLVADEALESEGPVRFRFTAAGDRYTAAWAPAEGDWRMLSNDIDGRTLSTRTAGGFVGAVFGPFAQSDAP